MAGRSRWIVCLLWLALPLGPAPLLAATCSVPSSLYPTLGAAVRDLACTTIDLAPGTYPENLVVTRSVSLSGAGAVATVVAGSVQIDGVSTQVELGALAIDGTGPNVSGCWPSLLAATGGARVSAGAGLQVSNSGVGAGACRLFLDGFESAGTLAWSGATP